MLSRDSIRGGVFAVPFLKGVHGELLPDVLDHCLIAFEYGLGRGTRALGEQAAAVI